MTCGSCVFYLQNECYLEPPCVRIEPPSEYAPTGPIFHNLRPSVTDDDPACRHYQSEPPS